MLFTSATNLQTHVQNFEQEILNYENTRITDVSQQLHATNEQIELTRASFLKYVDENTSTRAGGIKRTLKKCITFIPPILFGLIETFSIKPAPIVDSSQDIINLFEFLNSIF